MFPGWHTEHYHWQLHCSQGFLWCLFPFLCLVNGRTATERASKWKILWDQVDNAVLAHVGFMFKRITYVSTEFSMIIICRFLYLPPALIAAVLGFIVDFPVISLIALCKSPYMLFKGWRRLFHDLIGREGPFLETICVPFAGLAILLWPLATVGAVLGSMVSSIFLGAYAGVIVYQVNIFYIAFVFLAHFSVQHITRFCGFFLFQESSFWFGICYIIASLSIYDEYSNDVLDMPEGSCFARFYLAL